MNVETIIVIVLGVALLIAGGTIKRLSKEVKELITVFETCVSDGKITPEEFESLKKEAKDVGAVIAEIVATIVGFVRRKAR